MEAKEENSTSDDNQTANSSEEDSSNAEEENVDKDIDGSSSDNDRVKRMLDEHKALAEEIAEK